MTNSSISGNFTRFGENLSYDKHGNITSFQRGGITDHNWTTGSVPNLPDHQYSSVDLTNLHYNGNQVESITDSGSDALYTGAQDFKNRSTSTDEYDYDQNGNMTKDLNKDVVTMSWNSLNLPDTIQLKGGHMESFIYDAAGHKEQVTRVTVTTSNVTIPIGRTLNNAGISVTKTSAIKQVNNYYPFGMEYGESAENQTMMTYQDYQYGGKEFDRKFEINLYDFHARPYDATRAQWTSPDPLAEKYYSISPYAYCANNPMKFVDPDGKEIIILSEIIDGRKKLSIDVSGKVKNSTSTDYSHEQLQEYANRLMSSISEKYSGSGENIDYSCNVNLTVASSDNPVTSSDHVFNIVEQGSVQGYEGNLNAAGSTRIGSMTVDLSQNIVDVFPAQYGEYSGTGKSLAGNATLERTGSHEFGHTAGLKHSTDSNNLMKQTRDPNAGMKITEDQILKIVNDYNNDKLNK